MFTGIITAIGQVQAVTPIGEGQDMRIRIHAPAAFLARNGGTELGASIACSGCCLTAVALGDSHFDVDVSAETLSRTTLGAWQAGTRINLERSARLGDEMGGHIVSGHVDGLGRLEAMDAVDGSWRLRIATPSGLGRFIAEKGSIAVDGVSLTVNAVGAEEFCVNIIPHTASHTTLGERRPGDALHLEIDMLARYVARLVDTGADLGRPGPTGEAA